MNTHTFIIRPDGSNEILSAAMTLERINNLIGSNRLERVKGVNVGTNLYFDPMSSQQLNSWVRNHLDSRYRQAFGPVFTAMGNVVISNDPNVDQIYREYLENFYRNRYGEDLVGVHHLELLDAFPILRDRKSGEIMPAISQSMIAFCARLPGYLEEELEKCALAFGTNTTSNK